MQRCHEFSLKSVVSGFQGLGKSTHAIRWLGLDTRAVFSRPQVESIQAGENQLVRSSDSDQTLDRAVFLLNLSQFDPSFFQLNLTCNLNQLYIIGYHDVKLALT
jgi:hypothetical protein